MHFRTSLACQILLTHPNGESEKLVCLDWGLMGAAAIPRNDGRAMPKRMVRL